MPRTATGDRIQRLEALTALLGSGTPMTTSELAQRLAVSQRTLMRDLALLRERGLPVDASAGRGGGVSLAPRWAGERVMFGHQEAIDMLVALAMAQQAGSPLLLKNLGTVQNKLALAFFPHERERIRRLRRRILVAAPSTEEVRTSRAEASPAAVQTVQRAFFAMQPVQIDYIDQAGRQTQRCIQPHYLMQCWPVWYVLAWDELRSDVRHFRLDRIQSARLVEGSFRLLAETVFGDIMHGIGAPI